MPGQLVSVGDAMTAVVRPESIDIARADAAVENAENVLTGHVETAMYIGSVMRYTIVLKDKTVYLDESDPQYRGIIREGEPVNLILKERLHLLKSGSQ